MKTKEELKQLFELELVKSMQKPMDWEYTYEDDEDETYFRTFCLGYEIGKETNA